MNRQEYKKKRLRLQISSSRKIESLRNICLKCRKPSLTCYCGQIRPFKVNAKFAILMHPREVKKKNGTGRMAHLCIRDSILKEGIDFTHDETVNGLIRDERNFCTVLYPGKRSMVINEMERELIKEFFSHKRLVIFIIDASWSLARKIMKLSKNLNELPRVSLKPLKRSVYKIRVQPDPQCLSSIEAIHSLIGILEERHVIKVEPKGGENILMDLFSSMVEKQIDFTLSADGYRKTEPHFGEKPPSKKWEKRSLFYNK